MSETPNRGFEQEEWSQRGARVAQLFPIAQGPIEPVQPKLDAVGWSLIGGSTCKITAIFAQILFLLARDKLNAPAVIRGNVVRSTQVFKTFCFPLLSKKLE